MKVKIRNVLILLLGILVFGIIFCNNQVKAEDISEEYILSLIPDKIEVNLSEDKYEYEKVQSNILGKIKEILINNGIQYDSANEYSDIILKDKTFNGEEARIYLIKSYFGEENIYPVGIATNSGCSKAVQFIYEGYSMEDEKYIKNLKLQRPDYYEIDIEKINELHQYTNGYGSSFAEEAEEYYTNLINDSSITVKTLCTGESAYTASFYVGIIKNGYLYDVWYEEDMDFIPVMNVPNDIDDNNLKDYIVEQVKNKYTNLYFHTGEFSSIKKGAKCKDTDIINGYTMYFEKFGSYYEWIIINRETENGTIISQVDNRTNIKLDTTTATVPEDTRLLVEKITTGDYYNFAMATLGDDIDKFVLYDITLKYNGVAIQPNGKVKISIPIPEEFNKEKLVVYRITDNEKIKYDVKIETVEGKDYATFETDHFSLYTLAVEKTNNELDETPKTGNMDIAVNAFTAIAIISLAGIVIAKKNNK